MSEIRLSHFLAEIVERDLHAGKNGGKVVTRFPPEPNGFLHIGHSKSILLNFGLARQFGGHTHLRFDDTNPTTEDTVYVESIQKDVQWLGCDWGKNLFYASDFFERMYACAVRLIREGKAYVDSSTVEQIREGRGSFDQPGKPNVYRTRSVDENLALFQKMRDGGFEDGACVLRAKIDLAHPNVLMRDPLLYRIRHAHHHRTADTWCIYPMYDFAHPLEDAFEGVTHSICTLEFESNRELYDWVLDNLGPWEVRPRQYEFARLSLGYTVMSKRKLLRLVTEKHVQGWDDPRMPTIAGLRRRGVSADALRAFNELIGVAKNNSLVDIGKFEFAVRQDLEAKTPRAFAVLKPLRVVITNWPGTQTDALELAWFPNDPQKSGTRLVPFGRELLIEEEDFSENPPSDWKRLAPGREVRLIGAYVVRCTGVLKDERGEIREVHCTYDPNSRGGDPKDKRKIGGSVHWVHATQAVPVAVRLYDRLFRVEEPDGEGDFLEHLNPTSLVELSSARVEPALAEAKPEAQYQFLRLGYFCADAQDSRTGAPVFNRTLGLKDTWSKPAEKSEVRRAEKKPKDTAQAATPKKGRAELRAERRGQSPELAARHARYQAAFGLSPDDADRLTGEVSLADYFDAAVGTGAAPAPTAQWLLNELAGLLGDAGWEAPPLAPTDFGKFVQLIDSGKLATAAGKTLLGKLVEAGGGDPWTLATKLGLDKTVDASAVTAAVNKVLSAQAAEADRYRSGEKKLFGVLMGGVMRELQGAADPTVVRQVLTQALL